MARPDGESEMNLECTHGQLARACPMCELESEIDRLEAENAKLQANLDRHMEVIVNGRKANEALVARLKQIDDYLIERGIFVQLPEGIK